MDRRKSLATGCLVAGGLLLAMLVAACTGSNPGTTITPDQSANGPAGDISTVTPVITTQATPTTLIPTATRTAPGAVDWEDFRQQLLEQIKDINSLKAAGQEQESDPSGTETTYTIYAEHATGQNYASRGAPDGSTYEEVWTDQGVCYRDQGTWSCDPQAGQPADYPTTLQRLVSGTSLHPDWKLLESSQQEGEFQGQPCRRYTIRQQLDLGGQQLRYTFAVCFDLTTLRPLQETSVMETLENGVTVSTLRGQSRLYDINVPVFIHLPEPAALDGQAEWVHTPAYSTSKPPAEVIRASFDTQRWQPDFTIPDRLVNKQITGCTLTNTGGHGLNDAWQIHKDQRQIGERLFQTVNATQDEKPVFASYCTDIAGSSTCYDLTPGADPQQCQSDAEQVLASLQSIPNPQAAVPTQGTPEQNGSCENDSDFVADVTIPDDTQLAPNTSFTKTWRLLNSGNCTWTNDYQFVFLSGYPLGSPDKVPIGRTVDPGDSIDISLELVAPGEPGTYRGQWQLSTTNGELFGTKPYVQIIVP